MRFWKWLRRLIVGILVSAAMYAGFLAIQREVRHNRGTRELEAAMAETDASDPNWRWEKLNAARPRVPDEQNSALLIPKIKALIPTAGQWRNLEQPKLPSNIRYPDRVMEQARGGVTAATRAVLPARTLKDRPRGFRFTELAPNPIETLLPDAQHTREVVNLLQWNAFIAVEKRDYTHVANDLLACLNASRSIGDEPFLISQLVRIATRSVMLQALERVLAQTTNPEDLAALKLATLQDALTQDAEEPILLHGVRGDRAVFDTLLQRLGDGTIDIAKLAGPNKEGPSTATRIGWWIYRGRFPADRAFCLRWFNDAVAMTQLPLHEQPHAFESLVPAVKAVAKENIMAKLIPAVDAVARAHWRSVAETRCAILGIACERFRLKHNRWPGTLAELCPEFLAAVPLDPYDGQPLRFAKQDDGVIVHSVGPKPQSGRVPTTRPGLPEGIEIGFRLWNPDARRLPPPSDPPAPPEPKDEDKE